MKCPPLDTVYVLTRAGVTQRSPSLTRGDGERCVTPARAAAKETGGLCTAQNGKSLERRERGERGVTISALSVHIRCFWKRVSMAVMNV